MPKMILTEKTSIVQRVVIKRRRSVGEKSKDPEKLHWQSC